MKFILPLIVAFVLVFAVEVVATQPASAQQVAQCYWPKDSSWHYSPGYNVWFKWYWGSYNPVGFWYYGAMTGYQWVLYWNAC